MGDYVGHLVDEHGGVQSARREINGGNVQSFAPAGERLHG
jgi:hypothetical protein